VSLAGDGEGWYETDDVKCGDSRDRRESLSNQKGVCRRTGASAGFMRRSAGSRMRRARDAASRSGASSGRAARSRRGIMSVHGSGRSAAW